jgi:hypothetical protein
VAYSVKVTGLRETIRAFKKAEGDLGKQLKGRLVEVGNIVAREADTRGSRYAGIGAYKTVAYSSGSVLVRQSKGKVTGQRGDFGSLQMRNVLEPALVSKENEVIRELEDVIDDVTSGAGL